MPDPDKLFNTLRRAIEAFRTTPGRRGRVVTLPDATEVLAAGDLHGQIEHFRRLLRMADLGRQPRRHLVLQELIHGPFLYPSGGDKSHQLLDLLAALKCQYPDRVHLLLGNHELAQSLDRLIGKGDDFFNSLFREGVETAYGRRAADIYAAYLELFAVVPLAVRTANRVFLSHSLPPAKWLESFDRAVLEQDRTGPAELQPGGTVHALLWGRDTQADHVAAFLARVDADLLVTGHIPCENGFETPNDRQVILDCAGETACFLLFPADRLLTHAELVSCLRSL
jgi:hypothetical protein